jgi:hypothetical protein
LSWTFELKEDRTMFETKLDRSRTLSLRPRLALALIVAIAAALLATPPALAAEYFTEAEIEQIRSAQDLDRRIPVFLKIAEIRLGLLGLVDTDASIKVEEPGGNFITRTIIRALDPDAAAEIERERESRPDYENNLRDFSRAELLRGYYQAIEETMGNIDDAYERGGKGDVREALENLLEFTESTLPALGTFEPANEGEEIALEDAIEIAELARDGAAEALDVVPQTERR